MQNDKIIFTTRIFNLPNEDAWYRLYSDGREVVNVWEENDDNVIGTDMPVHSFLKIYGGDGYIARWVSEAQEAGRAQLAELAVVESEAA